jgi:hypothetical protein
MVYFQTKLQCTGEEETILGITNNLRVFHFIAIDGNLQLAREETVA